MAKRVVVLAALGGGGQGTLTEEVRAALACTDCAVGAVRLLDDAAAWGLLPPGCRCCVGTRPEEIARAVEGSARPCVLLSGDTGFYSGARRLVPLLRERGWDVQVLPGVSSMQVLAARLGRPWQDWRLVSAHGVDCDPVAEVCGGRPVFFLTGGAAGSAALCAQLVAADLGFLEAAVGENLTYPEENLVVGTVAELASQEFAPLSVLLVEAPPRLIRRSPGLPDAMFARAQGIPMTKQEVRAAALAKLGVGPDDVCWDVGCGTGSVAVELALRARAVWGVDCKPEALALAAENRVALGAWNLHLVEGRAPEVLEELPQPDAVFVGGSSGALGAIVRAVCAANPDARVCVAAIALESLHAAVASFKELGRAVEICQVSVARTREAGDLHLLLAQNPVFLVSTCEEGA